MKVLIIAAHPDDETMGAGGTIVKHIKCGDEVYLCVVTKAYSPEWSAEIIKVKREEVSKAAEILGIKRVHFLDLPTVKLDTVPQKELNELLLKKVEEIQPEIIYTTHRGDLHKDHRLVCEATMVVIRPFPGSTVRKVLCYELLSSTELGGSLAESSFIPNMYVDISETLETKLKAMAVYQSELKEYPHPRSLEAIAALAKFRGSTIGVEAAEAFMLVREIWH
ncbi:MAG: PIG-L deacetylase family protein [Dehalococcoidales bacterium]